MANRSSSELAISRDGDFAASDNASQLDSAGQAILKLLHKAAGAAEANSRRALETAQKLASQLRTAEDRITEATHSGGGAVNIAVAIARLGMDRLFGVASIQRAAFDRRERTKALTHGGAELPGFGLLLAGNGERAL